jgi:hypothetical protein
VWDKKRKGCSCLLRIRPSDRYKWTTPYSWGIFILPAAKAITKNLVSEKHVNEVSENTVKRRIDGMAQNVKDIGYVVVNILRCSWMKSTIFQIMLLW